MIEQERLVTGFLWFVAFLFSTTVHEAMHALVAWKGGDPTAYHGGQVTLSPIPHIRREPIGMLAVPLLTAMTKGWAIGWASAPYDPVLGRAISHAGGADVGGGAGRQSCYRVRGVCGAQDRDRARLVHHPTLSTTTPRGLGLGEPAVAGTVLSVFLTLNVLLARSTCFRCRRSTAPP